MTKKIRKSVTITPRIDEMIKHLEEDQGFLSEAEVVRTAVIKLHRDTYSKKGDDDGGSSVKVVQQKSGRPKKTKEEKQKEEKEKKKKICDELGGEVKNGNCHYYTYSLRDRFKQQVPLTILKESHLKNQYDPSKEKVEELQKEEKVNYMIEDDE